MVLTAHQCDLYCVRPSHMMSKIIPLGNDMLQYENYVGFGEQKLLQEYNSQF